MASAENTGESACLIYKENYIISLFFYKNHSTFFLLNIIITGGIIFTNF